MRERGIGLVVPAGDIEALADALETCLFDEEFALGCRAAAREVASEFTWDAVLSPLVEFIRAPRRAADVATAPASRRGAGFASEGGWRERLRPARATAGRLRRRLGRLRAGG